MPGESQLELPKFVWTLKIVQAFFAVLLFCLSCYLLSVGTWSADGLLIWASLYSILTLVYYFVSIHFVTAIYNWIALLVLESFAVLWWLVSWALLAATLNGAFVSGYTYYDTYYDPYYKTKRDLVKRTVNYGTFGSVVIACLAFSLVIWILYCVTLAFIVMAVVKQNKGSGPAHPSTDQDKEAHQMEAVPQHEGV